MKKRIFYTEAAYVVGLTLLALSAAMMAAWVQKRVAEDIENHSFSFILGEEGLELTSAPRHAEEQYSTAML